MNKNLLVIVTGPTASGKTKLAIEIAERYGSEIISADSRQIFKDLTIGTAAPTVEERNRAYHHLVGIKPLDAYYSAACFEQDALALLPEIWKKSPIAIVCGGSMMYVDALVHGIDEMPTVSNETRAYVLSLLHSHGLEGVLAQLRICDPDYFDQVDRANTRRVVHALEICLQAGKPYSCFLTGNSRKRDFKILKLAIVMPREELFSRINRRVDAMIAAGLEYEARSALAMGDFNSVNTVGYKEMRAYFNGEMDLDTAIARIGKNTRVYAKKQLTWLKRDPTINWIHSTSEAFALIDDALSNINLSQKL